MALKILGDFGDFGDYGVAHTGPVQGGSLLGLNFTLASNAQVSLGGPAAPRAFRFQ